MIHNLPWFVFRSKMFGGGGGRSAHHILFFCKIVSSEKILLLDTYKHCLSDQNFSSHDPPIRFVEYPLRHKWIKNVTFSRSAS